MILLLGVGLGVARSGRGRASGRRPGRSAAPPGRAPRPASPRCTSRRPRARRGRCPESPPPARGPAPGLLRVDRPSSRLLLQSPAWARPRDRSSTSFSDLPRDRPVSASQTAWTWARTRSSLARSSRGGVTAPATICSGPLEEVLVVRAAGGAVGEDQGRLTAPARATAALGVVGRGRRDVAHVDHVELGDVDAQLHGRRAEEDRQAPFAETVLPLLRRCS